MKTLLTGLLCVLVTLGCWVVGEVGIAAHQARKHENELFVQVKDTLAVVNGAAVEQREYFRQEQQFLNSTEIRTSLALGLRSFRNLDKTMIGLSQTSSSLSQTAATIKESIPPLLESLRSDLDGSAADVHTLAVTATKDLSDVGKQIGEIGQKVQVDLSTVTPVMVDLDTDVKDLHVLLANPDIKVLLTESAGTATELHGTAANIRELTRPSNLLLQGAVTIFRFTGLKWLTGVLGL